MNTITIDTKYRNGDRAFTISNADVSCSCNICDGTGKILYRDKQLSCPQCHGRKEIIQERKKWVVCDDLFTVQTIGIRISSNGVATIKYKGYMKSGAVNRSDESLFNTKEEAQACCDDKNKVREIIPFDEIVITDDFSNTIPAGEKIAARVDEYKKAKRFNNDIVVDKDKVLRDGYTTYLTCKMLGINTVKVIMEQENTSTSITTVESQERNYLLGIQKYVEDLKKLSVSEGRDEAKRSLLASGVINDNGEIAEPYRRKSNEM